MERMPGPEIEGACQPAQRCDQEMEGSEVMAKETKVLSGLDLRVRDVI